MPHDGLCQLRIYFPFYSFFKQTFELFKNKRRALVEPQSIQFCLCKGEVCKYVKLGNVASWLAISSLYLYIGREKEDAWQKLICTAYIA